MLIRALWLSIRLVLLFALVHGFLGYLLSYILLNLLEVLPKLGGLRGCGSCELRSSRKRSVAGLIQRLLVHYLTYVLLVSLISASSLLLLLRHLVLILRLSIREKRTCICSLILIFEPCSIVVVHFKQFLFHLLLRLRSLLIQPISSSRIGHLELELLFSLRLLFIRCWKRFTL